MADPHEQKQVEVVGLSGDRNDHGHNIKSPEVTTPRSDAWRSGSPMLNRKTKSRLLDPPEEHLQRSNIFSGDYSGQVDDGHQEDDGDSDDIPEEYKKTELNFWLVLQVASLVLIMVALVCSLAIPELERHKVWDLPLWKWELLVLALICGHLVSAWAIRLIVFLIERNVTLRKRVLYFVYGLKKSAQNCLWLGLVLLVWNCIFNRKVEKETRSKILRYVTKILLCFLLGTVIWLLKTFLVRVLASSFQVNTFFERVQESLFQQYVIETLSGPPLFGTRSTNEEKAMAEVEKLQNAGANVPSDLRGCLILNRGKRSDDGREGNIPVEQLRKLNQRNISAWKMKRLMNIILHGSLLTLDEQIIDKPSVKDEASIQIRSEREAEKTARRIFRRVAKPGSRYIYLDNVMRFMRDDEAYRTMHLLEAKADHEGISKEALKNWMVNAFRERRALALSLIDTKKAVDKLHRVLNFIVAFIIIIICLSVMQVAVTHFLLIISSQVLVMAFVFGSTCKNLFEAVIFLFVIHPFDVGDRCEVEGVQMVVEEINLLTTVFLRYDKLKIIYPNSVLMTKPIGNYYRSPDMGDAVDFSIHIATPFEKVKIMKERIVRYIENKSDHWQPAPTLAMREIEGLNRVMMSVWLSHRMNHEDVVERYARRALLVEEMVRIFKELNIEYRLLPLDVYIRSIADRSPDHRHPSNETICSETDDFLGY
ncbi:mechanosensitive ion channel protein 5-like [Punica granatum]|uniref:Mechanosensitive ion channel protein n=2 Tax=Punica granatum TaxID=22663 RepID=A0A218X828_PUNGR|nr:mechanosensitive ion channel protein 5-like [Punica granatum]OWM80958.1 hypothetical protein CDL15_Pgr006989 [Punica granatum]PKI45609.1 hypothetical protein CRG98_033925 [Punica granatum]